MTLIPELDAILHESDEDHPVILRCGALSTYLLGKGLCILWHWGLLPSADGIVHQGTPVKFPFIHENTRLVYVATGVEHVAFLPEDDCVFTWSYGN